MNAQLTREELSTELEQVGRCAVRMAVMAEKTGWLVTRLDVRASAEIVMPSKTIVSYGRHVFLAGTVPGKRIGTWIRKSKGVLHGYGFHFDRLSPIASAQRRRSRERWGLVTLPQPFVQYELSADVPSAVEMEGPLVAAAAPYFPDWRRAVAALMFDDWDVNSHTRISSPPCELRIALDGPWIDATHFGPSSVAVHLKGTEQTRNCFLQLIGPEGPITHRKIRRGEGVITVDVNYVDGHYSVVLHRDEEVLDQRFVLVREGRAQELVEEGVTVDPPPLEQQFLDLINGGEGPTVEFKQNIPSDLEKIDRAVCALANGQGGAIVVGVANDRHITGVPADTVDAKKDELIHRIHQRVHPFPDVYPIAAEVQGKWVVKLVIPASQYPPHGTGLKLPHTVWIRRGANNFQATTEEIGNISRARVDSRSPVPSYFG
jgi:hypothetical protein